MKVLVATDAHIFRANDGRYWCKSIYSYDFWKRYLNVYEDVKIVARVRDIQSNEEKKLLVSGPHVEIFGIPFYQGPKQLLKKYFSIQKQLKKIDKDCDVAILRMPSQTAYMVWKHLRKGIPLGGEIVYDPYDDQKKGSIIENLLNKRISDRLKKFCMSANGVSYVTEESIQRHYPSKAAQQGRNTDQYFEANYSSITLSDNAYSSPRDFIGKSSFRLALSSVAMNSDRKGESVLINVVKILRDRGYDVSAVLIGDGSKKKDFEKLAKELNIQEYVIFTGMLASSDEVREQLLQSDIFVFPTQAEGLPRGILEAMAVGLPVISTPVGGIPEIIERKYLFQPKDVQGFANMVCKLIDNPSEMNTMSKRNFAKSKKFSNTVLQDRRDEFYSQLSNLVDRKVEKNDVRNNSDTE